MEFIRSAIPDIVIIKPTCYEDERGYFSETFRQDKLEEFLGYRVPFCQENESKSSKGVLRGLHYQYGHTVQSKLVRVIQGKVWDVCVDIRQNSPYFGQHIAVELSSSNRQQLFVPRGFAHGFVVLEEETIFSYKVDSYYSPEDERGIAFDDPDLSIDWILDKDQLCLSKKDKLNPSLSLAQDLFDYRTNYYA